MVAVEGIQMKLHRRRSKGIEEKEDKKGNNEEPGDSINAIQHCGKRAWGNDLPGLFAFGKIPFGAWPFKKAVEQVEDPKQKTKKTADAQ